MSSHGGQHLAVSDSVLSNFLARPRNTPSARNARAREAAVAVAADSPVSGAARMRAVFSRLGALDQEPARQLAYERMVIEAKIAAVLDRADAASEGGVPDDDDGGVDMLERLVQSARENDADLRRRLGATLAKEVLISVASRDMVDALRLSVMSEEEAQILAAENDAEFFAASGGAGSDRDAARFADERAARLWRRRLWKLTIPTRASAALRWATAHDDVDRFGGRTLVNQLNTHDAASELSYYQKSALKYGRSARRRGSTGIAGAWEDVYDPSRAAALDRGAPNRLDSESRRSAPSSSSPPINAMLDSFAGSFSAGNRATQHQHQQQQSPAYVDAEIAKAFADLEFALERERALA